MTIRSILDRVIAGAPGARADLRAATDRDERAVVDALVAAPATAAALARVLGAPADLIASFESHGPRACDTDADRRRRLALLAAR